MLLKALTHAMLVTTPLLLCQCPGSWKAARWMKEKRVDVLSPFGAQHASRHLESPSTLGRPRNEACER